MALSNTATPTYYGKFRDAVIRGEIPVCREISMQMNRIDDKIANPRFYYDDKAIDGFIDFCEDELTLTDGSDLELLDSFRLWAEDALSWFYFVDRSVYEPSEDNHGGRYVTRRVKKRLCNKQYIITSRGSAKSMYASCIQAYFLNVDTTTTSQISPDNEAGRGGHVPDSNCHRKSSWAAVSVSYGRLDQEHFRLKSRQSQTRFDQARHRELPYRLEARDSTDVNR